MKITERKGCEDIRGLKIRKADQRQPVAKKIATASGAENYNLLQNNGRLAHQVVDHVCLQFQCHYGPC